MNKNQDLKCFFGLHKYDVYKEELITDSRNNIIGKYIVCRCLYCGKIRKYELITCKTY